jgi:ribosomal protein L7/L12
MAGQEYRCKVGFNHVVSQKVAAIKLIRAMSGLDLKYAKAVVDHMESTGAKRTVTLDEAAVGRYYLALQQTGGGPSILLTDIEKLVDSELDWRKVV